MENFSVSTIKCNVVPCDLPAYCDCLWTTDSLSQAATLCKEHLDELWLELNPLLKANKASFTMGSPGELNAS